MLFETSNLLTQWGLCEVILRLLPFVYLSDLPKDIFLHNFFRLALTHNNLLIHMLLLMKLNFSDVFTSGYQTTLLLQLFRLLSDSTT